MEAGRPTKESANPLRASGQTELADLIGSLDAMPLDRLRLQWRNHLGGAAPAHLPKWLFTRLLAYRLQAQVHGDLDKAMRKVIAAAGKGAHPFQMRAAATKEGLDLKPGSLLVREWNGRLERVMAMEQRFAWNGATYGSLSQVAKAITGTRWNGHRFFGLRKANGDAVKRGGGRTKRPRADRSVASNQGGQTNDSATSAAPAPSSIPKRGRIALSAADAAPTAYAGRRLQVRADVSPSFATSASSVGHEA